MKKGLTLIAAFGVIAPVTGGAFADTHRYNADPPSSYYVSADVLRVDPIYTTRTIEQPVRHCTNETREVVHQHDYERRRPDENYFVPGLFGGVIGGLIGNQFGGGSGKKALTVIGALAGSSIARDAARRRNDDRDHYHNSNRTKVCRTTYETEVVEDVSAYDVTYEYGGKQFSKRMTEHPGERVRIRVQLEPVLNDV